MADTKTPAPGTYTAMGATVGSAIPGIGTGIGTAIGAGLDVGSLIAGYAGSNEQSAEEKRRYEREQGLAEWQIVALMEKEKRERQKKLAMSNALAKALGGK
ncbi:MAG: hypothetical protein WC716_16465 [Chitinophagaceae bacterium]|jgi:hypothetical protein